MAWSCSTHASVVLKGSITRGKMVDERTHGRQQAPARRIHGVNDVAARCPCRQHLYQSAAGKLVADHQRRQLHDAHAGQRRPSQCHHVAGDETRLVTHDERTALGPEERPLMVVLGRAEGEAGVGSQFSRC